LEASGLGELRYRAESAGDVYVLDTRARQAVFEGHMNKGDLLALSPSQDALLLDGNNTKHQIRLNADHNYQIYFTAAE
jgi:hypothetical protein